MGLIQLIQMAIHNKRLSNKKQAALLISAWKELILSDHSQQIYPDFFPQGWERAIQFPVLYIIHTETK